MGHGLEREYGISLHYKIRKEIEKFISQGNFKNHRLPAEEELTKKFKVSRGTVRRAMFDLVHQGVLYRVPGKGTFVNPKTLSIERITIFSPWRIEEEREVMKGTYVDVLLTELRKVTLKRRYSLVLKNLERKEIEFAEISKESAGIIILNPNRNDREMINRVSKFSLPCVFIGANLERKDLNYVAIDNKGGIRKAIEYLVSLGHRSLFFVGGSPETYDTNERYEAFVNYCEEKNIKHAEAMIKSNTDWRKEVESILFELSRKKNLPDGFITGGLHLTLYLAEAAGKRIPDEFSLIGFDDFPLFSFLHPPVTTIYQPVGKLARKGFEILVENIGGKRGKKQVILETELRVRESVKRR